MNAMLVPFPMAPVNTKNVHRTNFLLGHPYGKDFVYDEMMVAPGLGDIPRVATEALATVVSLLGTGGLKRGAGPTREEREKGFYDILFLGELPDGRRVESVVTGEGGIWTPGALMGPALCKRLQERAGLTFSTR